MPPLTPTVAEPLAPRNRIPLWVKLPYTLFVCVLVPYYWHAYGPANFLYFCDVALLVTGAALWLESPLLTSLEAVAIVLPQTLWVVDFTAHALGWPLLGMTDYMFNPAIPLFVRGLSSFHGWLPFLLLWMLARLGYDRRALLIQTAVGVGLLLFCYAFTPPGPAPADHPSAAVNINYVFGPNDNHPQTWMPPALWLACLVAGFPLCIYLPTHLVLRRFFRRPVWDGPGVQEVVSVVPTSRAKEVLS